MVVQSPRRAHIAAGRYVDNTEAVARDADAPQRLAPAMEWWLRLTGQEVNVGKSNVWTLGRGARGAMQLLGALIPVK